MPITVLCPGCSTRLTAPDSAAGKNVKCPKCQVLMALPAAAPPPPPEEEPEFEVVEPPARQPPVKAREEDDDDDKPTPIKMKREERNRDDEDDDDDRPSRRRRRDDDDDDDDEDDRPWRKKWRKSRARSRSYDSGWDGGSSRGGGLPFKSAGMVAGVAVGAWLITLLISLAVPGLVIVPLVIAYLIMLAGGIWFLIIAFSDSVAQGLLCLCVPFYSLIYLISNWDTCKGSFITQMGGFVLYIITAVVGGSAFVDADDGMGGRRRRGQLGEAPPPVVWVMKSVAG